MTAIVPRSPEWHAERMTGIGSSDAPAIVGVSTWARPIDIWREKLGLGEPLDDTPILEWGRRLEPVIADAAQDRLREEFGDPSIRLRSWAPAIRYPDWPIAFAHVDRRTRVSGERAVVEIKARMMSRGFGEQTGPMSIADAHEVIPADIAVQLAHEMLCTGDPIGFAAVLIGYRDFRLYRFETEPAYLRDLLTDEQAFWALVETRTEPEPDGSDAYRRHLARRYQSIEAATKAATPEQAAVARRLLAAIRDKEAAAGRESLERQRLDKLIGPTATVVGDGWKATRLPGATRTDWKRVAAELAEIAFPGNATEGTTPIAQRHITTTDPSLRFTPARIHEEAA